jgi:uncharacterized protein RhaS with RHS repeats
VDSGQPSYYRARYYDSTVGRFLTEDPIRFQAGIDFYSYVSDNPIMSVDPLGPLPYPLVFEGADSTPSLTYISDFENNRVQHFFLSY